MNKKRNVIHQPSSSLADQISGIPFDDAKVIFPGIGGKSNGDILNSDGSITHGGSVNSLNDYASREGIVSSTSAFAELLKSMQNGASRNDALSRFIEFVSRNNEMTDEMKSLFSEYMLQLLTTDDQRSFDWDKLQESRLYNNPQNELARLMGAGVSRDAAIQMLSSAGGSGAGSAGSVIGSGSNVSSPSIPAVTGAQDLMQTQVAIGGAVDIIGALCNLLNTGMSFAQGVESVKSMRFTNYMNQEQKSAYDSVNAFTQAIQKMQLDGILDPADIDSWQNGDDVYKWFLDHQETNAVKPLIQSGVFQRVFGSTIGREMFNNNWHQQRDSRDYGTQLNQLLRQNELVNDLKQQDLNKSYYDVTSALYDLLMKQPQLLEEWNSFYISNEDVKQEEFQTTIYADSAHSADIHNRVQTRVFEDRAHGGVSDESGIDMISFDEWYRLKQAYLNSLSKYDEGDDYWIEFFRNNYRTAKTLSFIKKHQTDMMALYYGTDKSDPNPVFSSVLNCIKTLVDAGAFDALDVVLPSRLSINNDYGDKIFNK